MRGSHPRVAYVVKSLVARRRRHSLVPSGPSSFVLRRLRVSHSPFAVSCGPCFLVWLFDNHNLPFFKIMVISSLSPLNRLNHNDSDWRCPEWREALLIDI